MRAIPALPPGYDSWTFDGGFAAARDDVAAAVREALRAETSLYAWARSRPDRDVFHGRGETYAVRLGAVDVVVRHARRGGVPALFSEDWFTGTPRFFHELDLSLRLAAAAVPTPSVLAGVAYRAGVGYRADVATARVAGVDLASRCFGERPPEGPARTALFQVVGHLIRRLHDAGFVHPDLQLRNLLVTGADSAPPEAWLLDVDTCRASLPRDQGARRWNLERFYRSWDKWNRRYGNRLTATDRATFESAYAGGAGG